MRARKSSSSSSSGRSSSAHESNKRASNMANQPTNQPTNQASKQATKQASKHTRTHACTHATNQPSKKPTNQPSNQPENKANQFRQHRNLTALNSLRVLFKETPKTGCSTTSGFNVWRTKTRRKNKTRLAHPTPPAGLLEVPPLEARPSGAPELR